MKSAVARKLCILGGACLVYTASGRADESPHKSLADSTELTLDQLVNIQVTSVSKKDTKLSQSPAAISVVTQSDIHESGLTTIPELLRLVPGIEVSQINAHEWAVGIRGFGDVLANKVQVLIDGRTVYSAAVGGVHWDVQDVVLEDVERIEVIRGPGATLWGANSVNGVVNIITKSAKETQGGLVVTSFGTEDQPSTTVRYGGELATNLYYRVYVKYFSRADFVTDTGENGEDAWSAQRGGFRLDWEPSGGNTVTLQGDYYQGRFHELTSAPDFSPPYFVEESEVSDDNGGNILGRWTHSYSDTAQTALQVYYDHASEVIGDEKETHDVYDLDLQHRFGFGERHDLVAGFGYRLTQNLLTPTPELSVANPRSEQQLYNIFLQDAISLVPDKLTLTLGSKVEHFSETGFEVQPSGRILWQIDERQNLWSAVSRAVRTPTEVERLGRVNTEVTPPATLSANFGNSNLKSEELIAYELGYRIEATKQLNFDLATYYNSYTKLINYEAGTPFPEAVPPPAHTVQPFNARNGVSGHSYGLELSSLWQVTSEWRLSGGYSWLKLNLPADYFDDSPEHQIFIRSHLEILPQLALDASAGFFSRVSSGSTPAYLRVDLGLSWHPIKALEFSIVGQNLLSPSHKEFDVDAQTRVPRTVSGKVTWRF